MNCTSAQDDQMKNHDYPYEIINPHSWQHDPTLDGDGEFGPSSRFIGFPTPPTMSVYSVHHKWPDMSLCERQTWATFSQTASGAKECQPMSIAETLWQALLHFCERSCHSVRYDMRGGHSLRIQSGLHDGKTWVLHGTSWEQVVKKAVLTLMPGYWSPTPKTTA